MFGKDIFVNGKLHYGSLAWSKISKQMNNNIKPQSLYLIVSQNRYNILTNLKMKLGIIEKEQKELPGECQQDESDTDYESVNSNLQESSDTQQQKIDVLDLDIPYDIYFKMKPITTQYGNNKKKRDYDVLKPGVWTNIINEEMYKKFKLPCCFTFKRCKIYPTSTDVYLKIFARCKNENCQKNIYLVAKKNH